MKAKTLFIVATASVGTVAVVWNGNRSVTLHSVAPQPARAVPSQSTARMEFSASNQVVVANPPPGISTAPGAHISDSKADPVLPARETVTNQQLKLNEYVVQDPVARMALSFVGSDPDADAYWMGAINDPNLPAEERKDLIEDLNEDGLVSPHRATSEDLPIIAARLQLIEDLAPQAMDPVNAKAFGEAYKDLLNLYNGLPAD